MVLSELAPNHPQFVFIRCISTKVENQAQIAWEPPVIKVIAINIISSTRALAPLIRCGFVSPLTDKYHSLVWGTCCRMLRPFTFESHRQSQTV
ncbi:hypothetical protein V2G26_011880 [Clonostachys chloroleuca]